MDNAVTLSKPKFKLTKEEMIEFNDDCEHATIGLGNLDRFAIEDRVIYRGEITPKKLVAHWIKVLGRHSKQSNDNLSLDALSWMQEYKEYHTQKRAWKLLQKRAHMDMVEEQRKAKARKGPYLV